MSERLKELQRQRAATQEQLAWFDQEIARETGGKPAPTPVAAAIPGAPAKKRTAVELEAEKILEQYRHAGHPARDEVKRGCLLYFFAALGLLILALTGFWFLRHR